MGGARSGAEQAETLAGRATVAEHRVGARARQAATSAADGEPVASNEDVKSPTTSSKSA